MSRRAGRSSGVFAAWVGLLVCTSAADAQVNLSPRTEISVGGYIKFDAISSGYSDGDLPDMSLGRDFYVPGLIPVGGASEGRDTDFHAKSSRISLQAISVIDEQEVTALVELDFLTGDEGDERVSNSYKPRLRHLYFTYSNWLFGQTWSTFQNTAVLPETLDFIGPTEGTVFVRQALVRYSGANWQISLENPESTMSPFGSASRVAVDDGTLPDVAARYSFAAAGGNWVVAGLLRQLVYEDADSALRESATGYGVSVSTKMDFNQRDDLRVMFTAGKGLGRYLGLNAVNGAILMTDGDLEPVDTVSGMISYRHFWADAWRSTVSFSALSADHDAQPAGTEVTERIQSIRANLLHSPLRRLTFGGELMLAERELQSGARGSMNRVQFSAKYEF